MSGGNPTSARLVATLGVISILSGVLVVLTFELTKPRIAQNKKEALEAAVFSVLKGATRKENFRLDEQGLHKLSEQEGGANVFAGYDDDGARIGFALEAAARGYQDVVGLLYGYRPETECIIGITVLQSTETPGLGDKISTDPAFLANFECLEARLSPDGAAMANPIRTVKNGKKQAAWEIDGISGATVTSTAVGTALRNSTNDMLPRLRRALEANP